MKRYHLLPRSLKGISLLLLFIPLLSQAQVITSPVQHFPLRKMIDLSRDVDTWFPLLDVQHLPKPHPGTDRQQAEATRSMLAAKYPERKDGQSAMRVTGANAPVLARNMIGNGFNYFLPNDNDLAVSNADFMSSIGNTMILSRDLVNNLTYGSYTLHSLCTALGLVSEEFDPKILYDPGTDRFIVAFLNGFTDSTSNIIVGFSQTNAPSGAWNFYTLPGDALSNGLWTDFPMMAISEHELFINVNLLYNDSSWQTGFNQTIIWQIRKDDGYQGQTLSTVLHSNIGYNGMPIRNLCPIKGGSSPQGQGMFFLSNRNFTAGNDSVFIVEVTDTIGAAGATVNIQHVTAPIQYRMPVNVSQQGNANKLIVNDARILGGFLEDNKIQFVFPSLDTVTGRNGIYHGMLDFSSGTPVMTADVYVDATQSLGYPNISYAGINPGDQKSVINYLFSSSTNYPGSAAIAWDPSGFSTPVIFKGSTTYTNMLQGDERWGDYTGSQRKYNQPGYVWANGSYTVLGNTTRTWVAEFNTTTALGAEDQVPEAESLVFPNPSADEAYVKFNMISPGRVLIRLYDAKGGLAGTIFNGSVMAGENGIHFRPGHLAAGTYHLVVTDASGGVVTKSEVVKR